MKNAKRANENLYVKRAKEMTSSAETIRAIVRETTGWSSVESERIIIGMGNEVLRLTNPSNKNEHLVLRIHHKAHPEFYREKWAFEEVAKKGVPVPTVLSIGTNSSDGNELTYSLETALEGKTLDDLLTEGIGKSDKAHYTQMAGQILAKIHQVKTTGYGHFISDGAGPNKTLQEDKKMDEDISDMVVAASNTKLTHKQVMRALEMIEHITSDEEDQPHMVHCDYAPKHIFVHEGEITGIIDFEICLSGVAATDFNRWRAEESRITMQELLIGYKQIRKLGSGFWETMYLIQMHSCMRTLLYHFRVTKDTVEISKAADELITLLASKKPLFV